MEAFIGQLKEDLSKEEVGTEVFNKVIEQLSDATAISEILSTALQNGISEMPFDSTALLQRIMNKGDISDTEIQGYVETLNEQLKAVLDDTEWPNVLIKFNVDTKNIVNAANQQQKDAQKVAKNWQAAGSAIQSVGQALSQIEDPAAKVLGIIAQAVATMALSYAQAAASPAVTGSGWGWIAFAATGIATMISSISAIKNATSGFANGGIIPGNSMSGDNMVGMTPDGSVYGLNAQEVVLNRSQVGNLASQLEGGGLGNLKLEAVVGAEELIFILNNNGERRGYGNFIND
jgi:hypothetical protein